MKTQIRNLRTLAFATLTAIAFTFSTAILANDASNDTSAVELKFIGNIRNQPVYQLNLNNAENEEFMITIRDQNFNVLYSDRVKGKNISKKYLLEMDEIGDGSVRVEVKARKTRKTEAYVINRSIRFVDENVVTRL